MSIARKLMLLAGLALTALALGAGSASAQETPVEVVNEADHMPCNPCPVEAHGEATITTESGSVVSDCEDEFEGVIGHDGTGEITWVGDDHHEGGDCNVSNCLEGNESHWEIHTPGELATDFGHMSVDFCLRNLLTLVDSHCTLEVDVVEAALHDYEFAINNGECVTVTGSHIFINGEWHLEHDPTHPPIEIEHG